MSYGRNALVEQQKGEPSVELEMDSEGRGAQVRSRMDALASYGSTPPSYDEALLDAPPDYTTTSELATVRLLNDTSKPPPYASNWPPDQDMKKRPTVDFLCTDGIREHAGKKNRQAAKKAQQAKWSEPDNVDNNKNDDGNGDGNGDGGEGAGNGGDDNGDGGDGNGGGPPGGDGGGDEDENNNKKKKKDKKKKKKWEEDEEEEEQAAPKEAEEAVPAQVDAMPTLDAAGDANPDDEWGFQNTKSKKKGKKGKVGMQLDPAHDLFQIFMLNCPAGPGAYASTATAGRSSIQCPPHGDGGR